MRTVRRGVTMLVAVLAVAVLALSGCAVRSGSVAAYVGGQPISDAEIATATDGVLTKLAPGTARPGVELAVVNVLIRSRLATAVADERGFTITDGELDQYIAQQARIDPNYAGYQTFVTDPVSAPVGYGIARTDLVAQRLGGQQPFVDGAKAIGVDLNPRYGSWQFGQGTMGIPSPSGSLSSPLPEVV